LTFASHLTSCGLSECQIRSTGFVDAFFPNFEARHAGLIRPERDGSILRYVADMTGFRDLLAYLMEDCCNGSPQLCRPVINAVRMSNRIPCSSSNFKDPNSVSATAFAIHSFQKSGA